jgi:hypothetical protein
MAFMQPIAEYFDTMYHVDTREGGTEYVPAEVCGDLDLDMGLDDVTASHAHIVTTLAPYLQGHTIVAVEVHKGWYSRLSANVYLDCTHWLGPYATSDDALDAVQDEYEVDGEGDDLTDEGDDDVL